MNCISSSQKKKVQMANKYMRKCSTTLTVKDMQVKNDPESPSHPIRMAIMKETTKNAGEDAGLKRNLYIELAGK
jgi:hypothetical protein